VLDYLKSEPAIDAQRIGVAGHSRMGKTALWAAASDPRFAMVLSNNSGATRKPRCPSISTC
jgi:dipeptidyl aminopeptidase/acylaminoacyl peptidase